MHPIPLRRFPWTCEWGRFGATAEPRATVEARLDDVFWVCRHPVFAPRFKAPTCRECASCLLWHPPPRLDTR